MKDEATPAHLTSNVTTFVTRAREYCAFVEQASKSSLSERMSNARTRLLDLYSAAALLPQVEPTSEKGSPFDPSPPAEWKTFDAYESYWEVFDPYVIEEPVVGSLSDDLLDVYVDVRRGLQHWELGQHADAIWEWAFSFEAHWGAHAVDALRALHRACLREPQRS